MSRALVFASLGLALALAACSDLSLPPTPETGRVAPQTGPQPHDPPPDLGAAEDADGGGWTLDAGVCCPVRFTLDARDGEAEAQLQFLPTTPDWLPLSRDDAGVWSITTCMPLARTPYYFSVGYTAESDDGGLLWLARFNEAVPTELNAVVDQVNVFDPGAAATCSDLDAGVYAQLPDAG